MRTDRPENITTDTLKRSYWFVGHLMQFKRNAAILVIVGEVLLIISVIVPFAFYLYYAATRNNALVLPLRESAQRPSPQIMIPDPTVLAIGAVEHDQGQFDLYSQLKNENQGWRADFDFIYTLNGVEQPAQKMFLLPLEQKYVIKGGVGAESVPQVSYRIANLGWHRLSAQDVREIADRSQFEVKDIQLVSGRSAAGVPISGSHLTFTLLNHSVYKFWDFRVPVVLKHGVSVVGVALVPVFSLDRDEKKQLEADWENALSATSFEIVPDIDILNPSALRPVL